LTPVSPGVHTGAVPTGFRLATARIVGREDFTEDLFVMRLAPDIHFVFVAGQYVTIGTAGLERPYSIVSAPHESVLELFIEYVRPEDGGKLTPLLHALRLGEVITMRPRAKGRFTLRPSVRNHVMVSTVTGIAPFVSMVRQFVYEREHGRTDNDDLRFFVMQGASHKDEFVYDREFRRLREQFPQCIEFVGSISRPWAERNAGWSGPTGRINLLIEQYLERWALPKDDTLVYLCGNPGMIQDATARVSRGGWSVVSERFWRP
jgi:ferredoxin--NADP+ reductase